MWLSINEDVTVNLLGAKNIFVDGESKKVSISFSGSPDSVFCSIREFEDDESAEKFLKLLAVKLKNVSLFPDKAKWLEMKYCLVNLPQVLCFYIQAADDGFEFKARYTNGKEFGYKTFETQAEAREALRKVTIKIGGRFIDDEVLKNVEKIS